MLPVKSVLVLEGCWWCDGDPCCESCDGNGKVFRERCYAGQLTEAQFMWQELRLD